MPTDKTKFLFPCPQIEPRPGLPAHCPQMEPSQLRGTFLVSKPTQTWGKRKGTKWGLLGLAKEPICFQRVNLNQEMIRQDCCLFCIVRKKHKNAFSLSFSFNYLFVIFSWSLKTRYWSGRATQTTVCSCLHVSVFICTCLHLSVLVCSCLYLSVLVLPFQLAG